MPTNKLPDPPGKPSLAGKRVIRRVDELADGSAVTPADHEQRVLDLFHIAHQADLAWTRAMAWAQANGVSYRRLEEITGINLATAQSRVREGRKLVKALTGEDLAAAYQRFATRNAG